MNQQHSPDNTIRLGTLSVVILCLAGAIALAMTSTLQLSPQQTIAFELVSEAQFLMTSALALVLYCARKNRIFLFIGAAFLIPLITEGLQLIIIDSHEPHEHWHSIAGRTGIAILLLWYTIGQLIHPASPKATPASRLVIAVLLIAPATLYLFSQHDSAELISTDAWGQHPDEFLPAVLFTLALSGQLYLGHWRQDDVHFSLLLFLLINSTCHLFLWPASQGFNDSSGTLAIAVTYCANLLMLASLLLITFRLFRQVDQASLAKSEFLAVISHEIRTPMNVILGSCQLLSDTELNTSQRTHLQTMQGACDGLMNQINEILDFSKIDSGQLKLNPKAFMLDDKIADICQLMLPRAQSKQLELIVDYPAELAEKVTGDPDRVAQILINLLSNAIKFTDSGYVQISARKGDNDHIELIIEDTGIGFDIAKLPELLQGFNQSDCSTSRRSGGAGLGLSIVSGLVHLMSGELSFDSCPGQGCRVTISLPLPALPNPEPEFAPPEHELLIVNPQERSRQVMTRLLLHYDYQLFGASQNTELLDHMISKLASSEPIAGIVAVHNPPWCDAVELCRNIREDLRLRTPVMIVTQGADPSLIEAAEKAHATSLCSVFTGRSQFIKLLHSTLNADPDWILSHGLMVPDQLVKPDPYNWSNLRFSGKVLVVEDVLANMMVITSVLNQVGLEVISARNGQEGVEAWQEEQPDLILMDLRMPIMDGFAATKEIRTREIQIPSYTPIVALTADVVAERYDEVMEAAMDDFLSKPVDREHLINVLTRYLGEPTIQETDLSVMDMVMPASEAASTNLLEGEDYDEVTVLDPGVLDELANGVPLPINEIIDIYLTDLDMMVKQLCSGDPGHNQEEFIRLAHSVKGSSLTLGAGPLSTVAKSIEMKARSNPEAQFAPDLEKLQLIYSTTREQLLEFADGKASA